MKNISCLFLDIGGVLLSNGWGREFRYKAADKFHLNFDEMEDRHSIMFVTYEEGRITLDEYLDRVIFNEHRHFSREEFKTYMFSLTTPNLEMIAFIKQLKEKHNLKIVAVSNEARELNDYRIDTFDLNSIIDFFVSSCYVHIRKPDVRIFKLALDLAHVPAHEVIYIDDVQMFTDIATDIGIKSIQHNDWISTSKTLQTMGIDLEQNKMSHE